MNRPLRIQFGSRCHVDDMDATVAGLRARGAELVGEVERYEDSYRLCCVRDPEGIIVELAERMKSTFT